MSQQTTRKLTVLVALAILLAAKTASAASFNGYPCSMRYWPSVANGDELSVTFTSQAYCAGNYIASMSFYSPASGTSCFPTNVLTPVVTLNKFYETFMSNYWRSFGVYYAVDVRCGAGLYPVGMGLTNVFN